MNDTIEFTNRNTNESFIAIVEDLLYYPNFQELNKSVDKTLLGYKEIDVMDLNDMDIYYSKKEQAKYGVVGIKVRKI